MKEAIGKPLEEVYHVAEGNILISKDKIERPIEATMAPILGRNGKTGGVVIVFRDFTATMEKLNQVEYLSYHDKLTGLYNRRFYEEEVRRLDTERNLPLSIIMGDVNGLKLLNDSFGHLVGDELLRKVAEVLKNACRNDEIIARLGGDEFVILLPKTDEPEAERIINRLKQMNALEEVNSLDVSVAFGAATKLDPEDNAWEVLKRAEEKMYQEKLFESPKVKERTLKRIIEIYNEINRIEGARLEKMCRLCEGMGSSIGLDRHELEKLRRACTLHDIGKVAIDDRLFQKTEKLTPEDWEEVQKHSEIG
jgi:diguanylate cyclase (GGDEF)-like protein